MTIEKEYNIVKKSTGEVVGRYSFVYTEYEYYNSVDGVFVLEFRNKEGIVTEICEDNLSGTFRTELKNVLKSNVRDYFEREHKGEYDLDWEEGE